MTMANRSWSSKAITVAAAAWMAGQATAFLSLGVPAPINLQAQPLGGKVVTFTWAQRTSSLDDIQGFKISCMDTMSEASFEAMCDVATTCPPVNEGILMSAFELGWEDSQLMAQTTYSCIASTITLEGEEVPSATAQVFETLEEAEEEVDLGDLDDVAFAPEVEEEIESPAPEEYEEEMDDLDEIDI